ncbi:MAG: hypothetical protein EKK37_00730 [Sphingobacteriales bacterium]|nr:MAG: hypothetical protein EKK37_00730 [Sphingobacteriales bacterium]
MNQSIPSLKRLMALLTISLLNSLLLSAQQFGGNPASIKWKQINTDTVRVIFPAGLEKQAARVVAITAALQSSTNPTIGNQFKKINIILQNQTTIANGFVALAPFRSEFYVTPDPDNFSLGSLPWADNLAIHEYRHVQQYNNFNKGLTKVFSFFAGEQGRALANAITIPDWFFEGDAVFQETLVSEQGRGRMASFMKEYKALWQQNKNYSWMKLRNGSLKSFVPDHYHTGYQLVAYGYEKYGNDFWKKVTDDAARFKGVFYSFNNSIARNSGKSYKTFRNDAMHYFKQLSFNEKKADEHINFISLAQKNNVVSYLFPYSAAGKLITLKRTYRDIPAFYIIDENGEHKIKVKDIAIDNYYSYSNGKIIYTAYNNDARWTNRDYSDIRILDVQTGNQIRLTHKTKYFAPDISADGSSVLAVNVTPDGKNEVHILSATDGSVKQVLNNTHQYFFTQTKFLPGNQYAVSAVRDQSGRMALIKLNLNNGETEAITPFTYNVLGYPVVKGDTILFSRMENGADKLFAARLSDKKIFQLTNNENAFYQPVINNNGDLIFSAFTADGSRLAKIDAAKISWQEVNLADEKINDIYAANALSNSSAKLLDKIGARDFTSAKYPKATLPFNFHSWRPYIAEPEYGINFYGNNLLNTFQSNLYYTYNRDEQSHFAGFSELFGGFYPMLTAGVEAGFNRPYGVLFPNNTIEVHYFNSATLFTGVFLPLSFTNGRTYKYINIGASYNLEQRAEAFPGKEIFKNKSFDFIRTIFSFSNVSQQAKQNIYPHWAQTLSINYRDAITFQNSHKLVATGNLFFPGIAKNHSLVINAAFQSRDTLADFFTKTFPFSRGYEALNTRSMYKLGVNYHFTLAYPDWGFANLLYFTRIRANAFFDYTNAKAKYLRNQGAFNKSFKSTGGEIYFDTKWWNQLPVSIGVRYSYLLNDDLVNPGRKGLWEIILPLNILPN